MKLLNHTLFYFSVVLVVILGIWATVFYLNMLDEVYDSLDDGLDNYKMLIIQKAHSDSSVLHKTSFDESNYAVREIKAEQNILTRKDVYKDTLMYMQNEEDFEPVRILTTVFEGPGNKYYELKIISSMVEEDDLIEDLLYALLWLYVSMLVTIIVINNLILRRVWKPFYLLLNELKKFRLGDQSMVKTEETKVSEFRDLNHAVNGLIKNAVSAYTNQKQLIENASHELQTPLAISISKLELMLENETLDPDSAQTVTEVLQTLERLKRLNRSLLLLSKIENRQFAGDEAVDFNALARKISDDLSDFVSFRNIQLNYKETGIFRHTMHKDLAEILLMNLLKNAVQYTPEKGSIEVFISDKMIEIRNTGAGRSLNPEKIFTRFYRESDSERSSGLGLAIAKSVADDYRLKLVYVFDGMHIFKIMHSV